MLQCVADIVAFFLFSLFSFCFTAFTWSRERVFRWSEMMQTNYYNFEAANMQIAIICESFFVFLRNLSLSFWNEFTHSIDVIAYVCEWVWTCSRIIDDTLYCFVYREHTIQVHSRYTNCTERFDASILPIVLRILQYIRRCWCQYTVYNVLMRCEYAGVCYFCCVGRVYTTCIASIHLTIDRCIWIVSIRKGQFLLASVRVLCHRLLCVIVISCGNWTQTNILGTLHMLLMQII